VAHQPIPDGLVTLNITANENWYVFRYAVGNDFLASLAEGETRYLCTEAGAAVFTSAFFGIYATGNRKPSQTPADFDYFDVVVDE